MRDRQLAAGCLLGSFDGVEVPAWLLDHVRDGLGGVLLFAQNVVDDAQVAGVCAALHDSRGDVVIAIDEEGGDVTRLDALHGSDIPSPAAFGVVDDPQLTFDAFAQLGKRVRALGIDLTLAPCADINSNPKNPIIGLRAFGTTAAVVSRHVGAAIGGLRSAGLSACAKHYPGHGDTSADTHLGAARVTESMQQIAERELIPFHTAVEASVDAVLTAHIVVDALDAAPVSLSARWTDELRRSGFDGAIITDALDMDAVAEGRGIAGVAAAAVRALAAGADLLCLGSNFDASMTDAVIDAVSEALADGRLDRDTLQRSCVTVVALRRAKAAPVTTHVDAARLVAERAIAVAGELPAGPFAVLECRPDLSVVSFNVHWGIACRLAQRGWPTASVRAGDPVGATCDALIAASVGLPLLVVVRDAGVLPWQQAVIEHSAQHHGGTVVVVEMGWPDCHAIGDAAVTVVTHGAARCSADALIDHLVVKES